MVQEGQQVGVGGAVLQAGVQGAEHGRGALGVHVQLVKALGPLPLILAAVELEGIQVTRQMGKRDKLTCFI